MKAAVPVPAKKRKAPKAPVPGHDDAAAEVSADEDFDLEDGGQEEEEEGSADTELWTAITNSGDDQEARHRHFGGNNKGEGSGVPEH